MGLNPKVTMNTAENNPHPGMAPEVLAGLQMMQDFLNGESTRKAETAERHAELEALEKHRIELEIKKLELEIGFLERRSRETEPPTG